ncbi:MAG: type III pantothenate kinase [Spirochaetia bacterium]|nr:type III pantothenate kinase [Spirochaetia bacterium]
MILATADIGNTHSVFGLWNGRSYIDSIRISTNSDRTSYEWFRILGSWIEKTLSSVSVDAAVISSVVPAAEDSICGMFAQMKVEKTYKVTSQLEFPYKFNALNFPTIGADRLVNAAAGVLYYGKDLIIVDIGTAITFCLISGGEYMGGVIAPGIHVSLDSLARKAARLFDVSYRKKKKALAQSTRESLENGLYFGWRGLFKEIIYELKKEKGNLSFVPDYRVLATGGISSDLGYTHDVFDIVDPNLTLRGLMELYHLNFV